MQLISLVFLAAYVSAHATFQELWIGETDAGSSCARLPASNSPVTDVTSADIACNAGAASSSGVCPMAAGDSVTVEMHQQPNDRSCANEAIGGNHFGPQMIYMAAVDDATTAVGSEASWFKIHEMEVLNDNCGHYTFTIPDVAPGQYLLRAETIALHTAGSEGGAQFYMTCFQVNVTGSGTAQPDTVSLPGAYSAQDPGILINIYQQLDDYTVPGPAPYGFTAPAPINSAYPTTATWDTALQPTTVPTEVPEYTAGAGGATTSEVAATSAATSVATSVAASSSAAVPTSVPLSSVAATTSVVSSVAVPVETSSAPSSSEVVSTSAAHSTSAAQSTSAAVSTSAAASTSAASTSAVSSAPATTVASSAPASSTTGVVVDANTCMNTYNKCIAASQPNPDWEGCGATRDSCLSGATYNANMVNRAHKLRLARQH